MKRPNQVRQLWDRNRRKALLGLAATLGLAAAAYGIDFARMRATLQRAEELNKKGFNALAAEILEPYRHRYTSELRGCQALIGAYFGSRTSGRLEWASEACIEAGVESTDTYIGLAAARELQGRDPDAIILLQKAAERFSKSPDPLYRLSQVLVRSRQPAEALRVLQKAIERSPATVQLYVEAFELAIQEKDRSAASELLKKIQESNSNDAEVRLWLARAYRRIEEKSAAREHIKAGKTLLISVPSDRKAALEKAYADVLVDEVLPVLPPIEPTHFKPKSRTSSK